MHHRASASIEVRTSVPSSVGRRERNGGFAQKEGGRGRRFLPSSEKNRRTSRFPFRLLNSWRGGLSRQKNGK